jgi:hypothetical protein
MQTLDNFTKAFPLDPLSAKFKALSANKTSYLTATSLFNFAPDSNPEHFVSLLKTKESNIWFTDLTRYSSFQSELKENCRKIKDRIKTLVAAPQFSYYSLVFKLDNWDEISTIYELYSPNPFKNVGDSISPAKVFKGAYDKGDSVYTFRFMPDNNNYFIITDEKNFLYGYDGVLLLTKKPLEENCKPIHTQFVQSILNDIPGEPEEYETFLASKLGELKKDIRGFNPYFKIYLASELLKFLNTISLDKSGAYCKALVPISNFMETVDKQSDFDWMKPKPDEKDKMKKIISEIPALIAIPRQNALSREALAVALSRKINYVGILSKNAGGAYECLLKTRTGIKELWILRNASEKHNFIVIGVLNDQKELLAEKLIGQLIDGDILFAPFDNLSTDELAKKITDEARKNMVTINWPDSWPLSSK